ncbi:MAG: glycosyltransferase family 2 protein [Nitrospirota bacterium]
MEKKNPHISVVIPVYKCEGCLDELYRRLTNSLETITDDFEIIMIEDCGGDGSWDLIVKMAKIDRRVKGIKFSRNFGQHYAITAGLDYAKGDWIVVMDCDLQDQPEEIKKLYDKAQEGFDIVLGRRYKRQDNIIKRLASWLFYKVLSYMTDTIQDGSIANFGIYNKKVINILRRMKENLRYFPVMIRWVGFNLTTINIKHAERHIGQTSYSFKKLLNLAIDVIIAFSDKPLWLTVKLGFTISFLSFLCATYIILRALFGIKGVEGWPSLIVSIGFLSGLIIFILGLIGIYIGKIFDEEKSRPLYIIDEKTDN